ncbi:hypothetical protein [Brevundimonas sp.]|uniref:hypothetical protein n=1 Tax=Brevundimonas sp. TaxID=1871086 RepID=UPI002FCB83DD
MAEPGDPSNADDHDDLIGFASPASLQGRTREPGAEPVEVPEPTPSVEPEIQPEAPPEIPAEPEPAPEPAPDLFATRTVWTSAEVQPEPEHEVVAPQPAPVATPSIFQHTPETPMQRRRRDPGADLPGGGMGLYAVYALILFAVPTMGVSAVIGLLAVTGRSGPEDALSRSHFIYQQRTLWTAAVAAVAGIILLAAPFALGVPILFLLALWLVLRGASGVWALKSGHAIADPRGWWI